MRSNAFARAIIGPIGSAKSSTCCMEVLRRAAEQKPDAKGIRWTRWAVIRNTYRELTDTTRKTWSQWVPDELGKWNEQDFSFTIDKRLEDGTRMNCEVLFRALDKPQDVKKVLSLELTGAYINEGREIPRNIFDGLGGRVGRFPAMKDGGPTWFGLWLDSNPWPINHWGYDLFSVRKPEGHELFEQPSGLSPEAENVENLRPDYYPSLCHGKDSEWIDEYIHGKYPSSAKGSIYGNQLEMFDARGGMTDFPHPMTGIQTAWDLGKGDATAIWFWRYGPGRGVDVVDFYAATGQGLSHYFAVLREKDYQYTKHLLPHDAANETLASEVSIQNQVMEEFGPGMVAVGPRLGLKSGIAAGRWLMEQPSTRIHTRCKEGVDALRAYQFEWNDVTKSYSMTPLHNWASDPADAWRYMAQVVRGVERLTREVAPDAPLRKGAGPGYVVDDSFLDLQRARAKRV